MFKKLQSKTITETTPEVVIIAGMADVKVRMVVNIAGMTSGNLVHQGGQHHRNDPEQTNKQVVNITGIIKSTYLGKGWSAWPEQVVNIIGTGGQDGSDYTVWLT